MVGTPLLLLDYSIFFKNIFRFIKHFIPFLLVFAGGGIGSLARYALSQLNAPMLPVLPYGTIAANVLSCAILGLVMGIYAARPETGVAFRLLWATGFCGGFSTFSTFMLETHRLAAMHHIGLSLLNLVGSVVICWLAFYGGMWVGRN